jgi:hypothetical protein
MVGMKHAARFTSRMSNERSVDELHPPRELNGHEEGQSAKGAATVTATSSLQAAT